ncbi:MAG: translation initiation factor IF-3 [Acidobacteriaceae bacterium]
MAPLDALRVAKERGLDLVEISPTANPPVCKIQDFGKWMYEKEKSERAAKKNQKTFVLKEVKFRINVDEHDYNFKKNNVIRFLEDGDKVKATIFFRGREMTHTNLGREVLERLLTELGDKAVVEFRPRMEGNTLHAILAPPKIQVQNKPKQPKPPQAANTEASSQAAPTQAKG